MAPPGTPPILGQWILDTRSWYPEVQKVHQLETYASRAFAVLPGAARSQVLRYVRPADAKMALASALLKHYAVARLARARIPWSRVAAAGFAPAPGGTKPVFVDPATGAQPVRFNVSHQAGVVAIVAVAVEEAEEGGGGGGGEVQVGVDVVSPAERRARDHRYIAEHGWPAFVDMHAEVLGRDEVAYLKGGRVPGAGAATAADHEEEHNDRRLRAFYALWALREAYLKLGGTGLVADWVRDLEFRGFRPPSPAPAWDSPAREEEGQVLRDIGIWLRGDKVEDVDMCLRSVGPDFMIATAARTPGRNAARLGPALGAYEVLSLEDVLSFAEASG
ncbi:hypothetical protein VTH06DRAFT_8761 [Thermothelomyces fergusii]